MSVVLSFSQLSRIYSFGDYEFCVRSGELRKNGNVVRLQQQPSRVLLALLEYSGEVITREELRDRVWPGSSVQDFDNSLRVAVNKLRQALDDDPDNPEYVETLPRRGYRWLCTVTVQESPHAAAENAGQPVRDLQDEQLHIGPGTANTEAARPRIVGRTSLWVTVLLIAAVLLVFKYSRRNTVPVDPRVVPLTTYPGLEYMPSFSPDGKQVAFAWTGADPSAPYSVYVKPVGDERARLLTETPTGASDGDPVWSPDGKSIYFYRRGGEKSGIYAAPVAGGPVRLQVTTSLGGRRLRRARFDVSPNGKILVYPDVVAGKETVGLYAFDFETSTSQQISDPPANSEGDGDPAISHDGKTLAFQRNVSDRQEIYVVSPNGGPSRLLTASFIADFIDGMAWTSDDHDILLGGKLLRRISVSSDEQTVSIIPYVPGPALFPAIHEHELAFVQAELTANVWKLTLRDATHVAGGPTQLISSTHQQAAPAYSPDGSRIAFQSDRSGDWEIWTCARNGSDPVQLTHFRGALAGTPRWSPDGKQIVFDSRASGPSQIYMITAAGGEPRRLTNDPEGSEVPSWSRDGRWIYYSAIKNGGANVWKLPAQGGTPQPVTSNGGIYAVESFDGKYVYFSRNAQDATIWRVPVEGGVEDLVGGAPKPFDPSHWVLAAAGIYIMDAVGDLVLFDVDKHRSTTVFHDQRFITDWSMAVSPDGREVVWAQIDARLADLMLVEHFR